MSTICYSLLDKLLVVNVLMLTICCSLLLDKFFMVCPYVDFLQFDRQIFCCLSQCQLCHSLLNIN